MQSLQQKASEWSGVAGADAFAIDETNLFEKLGLQTFVDLSTSFYNRQERIVLLIWPIPHLRLGSLVFDDEEQWFRSIFATSKKEDAIRNQYEFFVQRMGGPPLYSERKDLYLRIHTLTSVHGLDRPSGADRTPPPFPVTHRAAERWLHHMQQALDSTQTIDPDSKIKMMNFFRHTAFFLVAGDELKNPATKGAVPACKHAASKPAAE
ncbi:unnamed protein product [Spirodela intermedia]|uniref:Uncharacterized protein n=1 Tax=Spirodela intermedia TaxID=51605 RepID=A0A7I8JRG4_SPIIN|nr:unnamed protein product [Spirodela intermedia]CAA6672724.1 unnamed protein product [Spirodela intermedia]